MAIDFPASPTVGQTFTAGTITYTWDGTKWNASSFPSTFGLGTAASPSITFSGDTDTGLYSPGANQVAISTNGTGRLFVDANGRVLTGTSTALNANGTSDWQQQIAAAGPIGILLARFSNNTGPARINLLKSRSGSIGSNTIVSNGDVAGAISFLADDGANYTGSVGEIKAEIDGVPGTGSLPGRIVFSTTPSGTNGSQERLRITSAGLVGIGTSAPGTTLHVAGTGLIRTSAGANPAPLPTQTSSFSVLENTGYNTSPSTSINIGSSNNDSTNNNTGFQWRITTPSTASSGATLTFNSYSFDGTSTYTTTPRMVITSAGSVGIGTTSPGSIFEVKSPDQNPNIFRLYNAYNTAGSSWGIDFYRDSNSGTNLATAEIKAVREGGELTSLKFGTSSTSGTVTERARIDSSGRLLVGTSSAFTGVPNPAEGGTQTRTTFFTSNIESPQQGVGIYNFSSLGYAPSLDLALSKTSSIGSYAIVGSGNALGHINFGGSDGSKFLTGAYIGAYVDGTPGANDMPGRLVFSTTADGASSPTERMRITNNGLFSFNSGGTPTARYYMYGYGTGTSLSDGAGVPNTDTYYIGLNAENPGRGYATSGRTIGLYASAAGSGTATQSSIGVVGYATDSIGYSGSVGVYGSTNSSVYSNYGPTVGVYGRRPGDGPSTGYGFGVWARAGSSLYAGNLALYVSVDTDGASHTPTEGGHFYDNNSGSRVAVRFLRTTGTVGTITTTTSSTAYNTSSDYRLKENITPLVNAIPRLLQIPAHRFNFIEEPNKTVDGFLAHEVAPYVPEAVTGKKDEVRIETYEVEPPVPPIFDKEGNEIEPGKPPVLGTREVPVYQGIDQSKLVPLLTAALQELVSEVESLKSEVAALKAQ